MSLRVGKDGWPLFVAFVNDEHPSCGQRGLTGSRTTNLLSQHDGSITLLRTPAYCSAGESNKKLCSY